MFEDRLESPSPCNLIETPTKVFKLNMSRNFQYSSSKPQVDLIRPMPMSIDESDNQS